MQLSTPRDIDAKFFNKNLAHYIYITTICIKTGVPENPLLDAPQTFCAVDLANFRTSCKISDLYQASAHLLCSGGGGQAPFNFFQGGGAFQIQGGGPLLVKFQS